MMQLSLQRDDQLLRRFEEIHDHIYANDGLSAQQSLDEFVKLLFIKVVDEGTGAGLFYISTKEWDEIRQSRVSANFHDRIGTLFDSTVRQYPDVFDNTDKISLSPFVLGFVVTKLQSVALLDSSNDAKGLAFQKLLSNREKVSQGQFFTPEPVIDFCVSLVKPKYSDQIIDPACGSGGFLTSAIDYMRKHQDLRQANSTTAVKVHGVEINRSLARIAKMKLILEELPSQSIVCANALADIDDLRLSVPGIGKYDMVLTNPPFGAKISQESILSRFDLGHRYSRSLATPGTPKLAKSQSAEVLFIERSLDLLKVGGQLVIVLPNGTLENPSVGYVRDYLRKRARILAVIKLPQETFIPYGTGVKTSILVAEKQYEGHCNETSMFFGKINKLGYHGNKNGTPVYKRNSAGEVLIGHGNLPIVDEDFTQLAETYNEYRSTSEVSNSKDAYVTTVSGYENRLDYDYNSPENRSFSVFTDRTSMLLGELCEIVNVRSKKLKNKADTVRYVELSDVNTNSYEIVSAFACKMFELPSRASYDIKAGDILTAVAGNSIGTAKHATALVTEEHEGCICSNGFRVLRNFSVDPFYLLYYMKTEFFLRQVFMCRTGAAIPSIADAELSKIIVYMPEKSVMDRISALMQEAVEFRRKSKNLLKQIDQIAAEVL